jgi:hypothetical protein
MNGSPWIWKQAQDLQAWQLKLQSSPQLWIATALMTSETAVS